MEENIKRVILTLIVCPPVLLVFQPNSPSPRISVWSYSLSLIKKSAASTLDSRWDHPPRLSNPTGGAVPPAVPSPCPGGSALPLMDSRRSGACRLQQRWIYGACCGHVALVARKQAWGHLDSPGFAALRSGCRS